jgi:hypothetical protein
LCPFRYSKERYVTGNLLIEEGERLARNCVWLLSEGNPKEFAGVWRGPGLVSPMAQGYEHWLSIGCRFLPRGIAPDSGCLSVYTKNVDRYGMVIVDPAAELEHGKGRRLHAQPARSLPPIDAVFRFGSSEVRDWLVSVGWQPDWEYNDNFRDRATAEHYLRHWQQNCPLYREDVFAVLGGWHFPWPDGDWAELLDRPLVLWTVAESEPWVEVWGWDDGFRVIQRVT